MIINAPTATVWNAIVDGDVTVDYFYGTRVEATWRVGDPISYLYPDGSVAADGTILTIEPGVMVERYFHPRWDAELEAEGPAREIWRVDDIGGATKLTIELYETPVGSKTHTEFSGGLVFIASASASSISIAVFFSSSWISFSFSETNSIFRTSRSIITTLPWVVPPGLLVVNMPSVIASVCTERTRVPSRVTGLPRR